MNLRRTIATTLESLTLVAVGLLVEVPAHADEVIVAPEVRTESRIDGARVRVGVALEVGGWTEAAGLVTQPGPHIASTTDLLFGLQLEIGVQLNHRWGLYVVPSCGFNFPDLGGATGGGLCEVGLMADYTVLDGLLSIGAGPEVGEYLFVNSNGDGVDNYTLVGGRARLALHLLDSGSNGASRRRGFTVGFDAHFLDGLNGSGGTDVYGSTFIFSPRVTVGYTAF